ncbi:MULTISPECIES: AAA family ATPase [Oceanobacillus]|uniref:TniB family NTP-binding protein n=2 Tax=Oceanobacillus TaxID=182709 RepID=A0AAW5B5M4_9BACI|nr:TniB family NTP-binding protein [Oceanobacillus jordanicus]MCG3419721.1 TniB family NTP-binding protein [Oceanobacillus jordanicus]
MEENKEVFYGQTTTTILEKKNFFRDRTINHPIIQRVHTTLIEKIEESKRGRVYQVFGPTGVGKSTLCKRVKIEILNKYHTLLQEDKGIIPIVSIELPSPDNGKFNWKDFYRRMLKEMNEPLIEYKIVSEPEKRKDKRYIPNHLPSTAPELRESLENAIIHRETKIILLDEAQHLLKIPGAKAIQDQMDAIKSIANLTGAVFVMFGTYDLMSFFDLNGQLGRRTNEIHFRRYDLNIAQDVREFKSVIYTFENHLPLSEKSELVMHWEFLYERTVGCIGILKEWLDVCLIQALNRKLPSISYEILKNNAPLPSKALKIAEEAIRGERDMKKREDDSYKLQQLLGLSKLMDLEDSKKSNNKTKNKEVGKRNPNRDEIGITEKEA